MIDLNAAAIFVRVVEARGFSAAARLLGSPKTTVSKKVGDLERALGVRLLNRTTRRIAMTEAGEAVYRHCLAALQHIDAAERAVQSSQQTVTGMLTVGAPGPLGAPFLLPAITAFMDAHPAILITHLAVDTPVDLATAGIDVLLIVGSSGGAFDNVRTVTSVEVALYASADYVARRGLPATPMHLRHHAAIVPTQALTGDKFAWTLEHEKDVVSVVPDETPRLRSNDAGAILAAVAAGHGIGALSTRFVAASPLGAGLVPVLPEWRVPAIELSALYRDGSSSSLRTRLFLDFIVEWFRATQVRSRALTR